VVKRTRREIGVDGEDIAAAWYEAHGYQVIDRNWRCRDGELDLVLRNGRQVVFCEVKHRTGLGFGTPAEAITREKKQRIRFLAARWLQDAKPRPAEIRFDVAAVLDGEIEVLEGAF
jgi:putative endonuclease